MQLLKALFLAATTLSTLTAAQSADKTGYSGTLSSLDGGLAGTVHVVDAKTLKIEGYTLQGVAPALYWWGAATSDIGTGFRISNMRMDKTTDGEDLTVALDTGKTTADFAYVGLWCEQFSANFGVTQLSANGPKAGESGSGSGSGSGSSGTSAGTQAVGMGSVGALAIAGAAAALLA